MNNEEILKEYRKELNGKYDDYMGIFNEWGTDFFDEKHLFVREKLHLMAMDCINKILLPELKIFVRNLCSNHLGYPDEVIFYKLFGNNPEIGKKITKEDFERNGIDSEKIEELIEMWGLEGNFVGKETVDGKEYFILEDLCERQNLTSSEELERLEASIKLKEAIFQKTNMNYDERVEYVNYINTLLGSAGR
ncbi:MAG: hypothetical protein K6G00_08685 [Treponema sp.]|nr:hypothetical protein [Treponema sp.]